MRPPRWEKRRTDKKKGWGYAGGSLCLLIDVALAMALGDSMDGKTLLALCIFIPGLWWFGFSLFSFRYLTDRIHSDEPDAMPDGSPRTFGALAVYGWRATGSTIAHAKEHSQAFTYLILWFFFRCAARRAAGGERTDALETATATAR